MVRYRIANTRKQRPIGPYHSGLRVIHHLICPALAGWANYDGLSGLGQIEKYDFVPLCAPVPLWFTSCHQPPKKEKPNQKADWVFPGLASFQSFLFPPYTFQRDGLAERRLKRRIGRRVGIIIPFLERVGEKVPFALRQRTAKTAHVFQLQAAHK